MSVKIAGSLHIAVSRPSSDYIKAQVYVCNKCCLDPDGQRSGECQELHSHHVHLGVPFCPVYSEEVVSAD